MLDIAAEELDLDPLEIRKKNFIPPDAFPYDNVIIDQAFTTLILDSGNYVPVFEKAAEMIGYQ
jgi:CO/xanthine dehydrogenase Mo-binding subunit